MERILDFEAFPDKALTVLLFKDVTNSREMKDALISDSQPTEAAFINAEMVPDLLVLHVAALKTLVGEAHGGTVTTSLHSELVYNVSGSKHVFETLKRWGISEDTPSVIVAKFNASAKDVSDLKEFVRGTQIPAEELPSLVADRKALMKAYKVTDAELQAGSLTDAAVTRIAARDCF